MGYPISYIDAFLRRANAMRRPTGALPDYVDPYINAGGGENPAVAAAVAPDAWSPNTPGAPKRGRLGLILPENFPPDAPDYPGFVRPLGQPDEYPPDPPSWSPPSPILSPDHAAIAALHNPAVAQAQPRGALAGPAPMMSPGDPPGPTETGVVIASAAADEVQTGVERVAESYQPPESVERARAMAQEMMAGPDPQDKWLAVALAGAQMAASRNPSMLGAAGEGAVAGLGEYARQRGETRKTQLGGANLELAAEGVSQTARAAYDKAILDAQKMEIESERAAAATTTASAAVRRAEATDKYYQALVGQGKWKEAGVDRETGDVVVMDQNTGKTITLDGIKPKYKDTKVERLAQIYIGQGMDASAAYVRASGDYLKAATANQRYQAAWQERKRKATNDAVDRINPLGISKMTDAQKAELASEMTAWEAANPLVVIDPYANAAASPPPGTAPPPGTGVFDPAAILSEAQAAIARGADPAAVKARLEEMGVDPSLLGE